MTQFDARMGFAPALLCIEEEPLKKTATVTALKPHPKQKEFDAFAKGNHIAGMIAGASVGVDLASLVSCTTSCLITEYMTRYDVGSAVDELTFYTNGQSRSIFRGANDKENKTATEIQMKIREAEQRMLRSVLDNMSISRPMPQPSGLGALMDEQRRQEKRPRYTDACIFGPKDAIVKLTKEKCDVAAARLDAAINGKPIEDYDFWANFDKASHLGGSPFVRFKNDPVAEVKLQTPANPGLADVNAKLQELSGETLKFKRFKPQLTGAIDWGFDPAKADES